MTAKTRMKRGKSLAIIGTLLQMGLIAGISGTVIGMNRAFMELKSSGTADQEVLASGMRFALNATVIGLISSLVGAVFIIIALTGYKYRARWFYVTQWIFAVLWLGNTPLGSVFGVFAVMYLIKHKTEFTAHNNTD